MGKDSWGRTKEVAAVGREHDSDAQNPTLNRVLLLGVEVGVSRLLNISNFTNVLSCEAYQFRIS